MHFLRKVVVLKRGEEAGWTGVLQQTARTHLTPRGCLLRPPKKQPPNTTEKLHSA